MKSQPKTQRGAFHFVALFLLLIVGGTFFLQMSNQTQVNALNEQIKVLSNRLDILEARLQMLATK